MPFLGKNDPKSEKFHKAKKKVMFWCFWGSFLNFFDFKRLGHFWLIFRSQFLFFRFLGVKDLKTKNFQKCNFLVLNRQIFHILWNFSDFEFLTPKSQKNKNWLRKISQKWPKRSKSKKFMKEPQKHQNYTFFWLYIIFLILGHFFLKMAKTVIFIVIFSNI